MSSTPVNLAWRVELHGLTSIVFAPTKPKARYKAVASYWEAYGGRRGEWPRAVAHRAEVYDRHPLAQEPRQLAYSEEYIRGY